MHVFESLQVAPVLTWYVQPPSPGLQVPNVAKHWPGAAAHVTVVPAQEPFAAHRSLVVHALPSLQTAPASSAA